MGLDTVELIIQIEETFGVTLEEDDAVPFRTVGDLFQYVMSRRASADGCSTVALPPPNCEAAARNAALDDPEFAWLIFRDIVANQLGVDLQSVTPSARLVEDLGAS